VLPRRAVRLSGGADRGTKHRASAGLAPVRRCSIPCSDASSRGELQLIDRCAYTGILRGTGGLGGILDTTGVRQKGRNPSNRSSSSRPHSGTPFSETLIQLKQVSGSSPQSAPRPRSSGLFGTRGRDHQRFPGHRGTGSGGWPRFGRHAEALVATALALRRNPGRRRINHFNGQAREFQRRDEPGFVPAL